MKCLAPDCQRKATRRGLCMRCYQIARNLVVSNQTTWAALDAAGKIKNRRHFLASTKAWLLDTKTETTTPENKTA